MVNIKNAINWFKADMKYVLRPAIAGAVLILSVSMISTVSAQAPSSQIKLALGDVSMNKLPFILAYDAGIFEQNDLNIVPMFTRGSVDIIRRSGIEVPEEFVLKSGEQTTIKVGGAAPTLVRLMTQAGAWDPLILGSTHYVERWRIIGRQDISSAAQLKGKRIGYSGYGAVSHMSAINFARAMGWDPNFDWSMMGDALGVEALDKGYIDAMMAPELHATMGIDSGYRVIVDLADYNLPIAGSSFLVDREWYKTHSDEARRFVRSAVQALALLKTNKQEAFKTMSKWYQMSDPELMEHFYDEAAKVPRKPYPPIEGLKSMMDIYDSHEMRKYTLEYFYDDRFVRELDESGYIDSLYE